MERLRPEELPALSKALNSVRNEEDTMLQFTPDGINLLAFVETGETIHRTVTVGDETHVFNIPVKAAQITKQYDRIADYAEEIPTYTYSYASSVKNAIDNPAFLEWKESLPDQAAFKEAAAEILADPEDTETMTCTNCKGKLAFTRACSCGSDDSIHYHDLIDGTSLSNDAKETTPDDTCESCHGTGHVSDNCSMCNGVGYSMKYPRLRFVNEMTGAEHVLDLRIAQLLVDDLITVELVGYENTYENGDLIAELGWMFRIDDAVKRGLTHIGIDPDNAAQLNGPRVSMLRPENVRSQHIRWSMKDGVISTGTRRGALSDISPRAVIEDVQTTVAHDHAWVDLFDEDFEADVSQRIQIAQEKYGQQLNDDGVLVETTKVMTPLRPTHEAFNDLADALFARGFTLGQSLSFIATGEAAPSFYMLDQNQNVLAQLSNDYSIRESIENAWRAFQRYCQRLDAAE